MASRPVFPVETLPVLAALYEQPTGWQDEAALAPQAGLAPDQLRVIVSQLVAQGFAQVAPPRTAHTTWPAGRRYRLTADGLANAAMAFAVAALPTG